MDVNGTGYEILSKIREDKDVWLVRSRADGCLYVRKQIKNYEIGVYERLRELALPGLPRIIDMREEGECLILTEEYIHGKTAEAILRENGPLPEERVREIMCALCSLLAGLHGEEPPMIHRDIKPSNIMIGQNNEIWLLDFNAVREVAADGRRDTRLMGTPDFAAPEQYGFGQSDVRTDIYGLGVTMNVLLTGEVPQVKEAEGPLGEVVRRCTKIDPEDRYSGVQELYEALCEPERRLAAPWGRLTPPAPWREDGDAASQRAESRTWRDFLPVGFRSGKLYYAIPAALGYPFLIAISVTAVWRDDNEMPYPPAAQLIFRLMLLTVFLFIIAWCGNYLGVRKRFLWTSGKGLLSLLMCAVWLVVLVLAIMMFYAIVSSAAGY